ncbi:MAG: SLBB domain-containing protein [Bacteroidales bacterium]|nr:SLBB domain-containing protein [Bacteroidales bacterium]
MNRYGFFKLAIAFMAGAALFLCAERETFAQMTDSQVIEYAKKANKSGKSQQKIVAELLSRGVTEEQLMRIKDAYTSSDSGELEEASSSVESEMEPVTRDSGATDAAVTYVQTGEDASAGKDGTADSVQYDKDAYSNFLYDKYLSNESSFSGNVAARATSSDIFGHNIFQSKQISFEPNENGATPRDYTLGPNDEVIIEVWGFNEAYIRQVITPEGTIFIDQVGRITLAGLTIGEASEKIKKVLGAKYSGIDGETPNTEVSVSLGQIRTIQVNVLGDVYVPGSFRISPFSTVLTALYRAGGVTENGSLRDVKLVRGDKVVSHVDVYDYIFKGDTRSDIRLQDGDILIVPSYGNVVTISGYVKRPMHYEMKDGESLAKLIEYAGGFDGVAYSSNVSVFRKQGSERSIFSVSEAEASSFALKNGDEIKVEANLNRFSNLLEIQGSVFRPGLYELGDGTMTVSQLVEKAGGLTEDAFLARAVIHREKDDLSFETVSVPIGDILSGARADIPLKKNDLLVVSSKFDIDNRGTLTINGCVNNPGTFPFSDNTTIEDLILQAGGLQEGVSLSKVDVSRRFYDPYSGEVPDVLGETFVFSISDGLVVDEARRFVLEPYDVVSVRKSPAYREQQFVTLSGEVVFPGEYVLQSKSETLSSLIERAGGLTKHAYLKGGLLTRKISEEQKELNKATERLSKKSTSSNSMDSESLMIESSYNIGVDMEKAIANPGSRDDIILMEGDRIHIPENVNVVNISGEVLYPNVVVFQPGKGLDYYINQAGGYTQSSKRNRVYVVYMNGNVSRAAGAKLEPGCQIVVPKKRERNPMTIAEVMSIGTSTASLATMVVSLINQIK